MSNLILEELNKEGQIIRKAYQRRLPSNPAKDYYFMHRNTGITEPVIVEYGFIDNVNDANKLKNNYKEYADAVIRAILNYIGYNINDDNIYIVKPGDSLYSIANKNNISVEELKQINNLNSNLLMIGQKLKLPSIKEPEDYTIYIVEKGDTLFNIASKYNVSVEEIIDYNGLDSKVITLGQKLLIPTNVKPSNYENYIVKAGDTLYSIANKYSISVDKLKDINNLKTNTLNIGQKILIPKINLQNNYNEYIVKSGDSLYSIANKFNTSVSKIKLLNNLNSNLLIIGQKLKIPNNEKQTYVVKSGDNLYSIANKFNTTVDNIMQTNKLSTNLLKVGQVLII